MIVILCVTRAVWILCFFQAEDGIRDLVRSRGLGDVYKRQLSSGSDQRHQPFPHDRGNRAEHHQGAAGPYQRHGCLLYTSDAADERSSVDLGGRRIITKKKQSMSRNGRTD